MKVKGYKRISDHNMSIYFNMQVSHDEIGMIKKGLMDLLGKSKALDSSRALVRMIDEIKVAEENLHEVRPE